MTWLEALREQCEQHSQKWAGDQIGYSAAVVNQVLKGVYKGDVNKVEKAVKGAFLNETVQCPVLGTVAGHVCLEHQKQPFAAINPVRVKLYKACRNGCKNSKL